MNILRFQSTGSRVLLVALFVFAVVSNVRLVIRNSELHERVKAAKADVENMELRNQRLSLLMNYYQSASYQEVEARRRLGMKRPDEAAYIIKGISLPAANSEIDGIAVEKSVPAVKSNAAQWWEYLRGK